MHSTMYVVRSPTRWLALSLYLSTSFAFCRCGLGSDGTDKLVQLVGQIQAAGSGSAGSDGNQRPALFGAKITGGGSGGTVCVLSSAGPEGEAAIVQLTELYRQV
jgi:L-arabinokinase